MIAQSLMLQQAAQQAARQQQLQLQQQLSQQLAQQQQLQSVLQQHLPPQQPFAQPQNVTPSWTMKPCTESSQDERYRRAAKTTNLWEKASAAVWRYDTGTRELGVTWMNDDG
ncbi:hypothetical protein FRC00_011753, partial [Tulasnella sp. 408]